MDAAASLPVSVADLLVALRYGKFEHVSEVVIMAIRYYSNLVKMCVDKPFCELLDKVKLAGKLMSDSLNWEYCVSNVTKRVHQILIDEKKSKGDNSKSNKGFIRGVEEALQGMADEVTDALDGECFPKDFIHQDDVVLIVGYSPIVMAYLRAINFSSSLMILRRAPFDDGFTAAQEAKKLIPRAKCTVITDSSLHTALTSGRSVKTLLEAHLILGDGTVVVPTGGGAAAFLANSIGATTIALAPLYALTDRFRMATKDCSLLANNSLSIPYSLSSVSVNDVETYTPLFESIPPNLVSVVLSSEGAFIPDHVLRIRSDLFGE